MSDASGSFSRRTIAGLAAAAPLIAACAGASEEAPAPAAVQAEAPLQKSISLVVRRSDLTPEQFKEIWIGEHGPGARDIPGLRGFILGEVVPDPARSGSAAAASAPLDGITESWQPPGIDRAAQAREYPHVAAWLATGPRYIGAINIFSTREHVFVPPRRGGLKVMTLISRKPEMGHEEFVRHVLEVHGPMARDVPGLNGYVMSEITRRAELALPPVPGLPEIDIIGTSWLPIDPAQRTPDSPQRRAWLADGAAHFGSFLRYAMVEHIFVPPPN